MRKITFICLCLFMTSPIYASNESDAVTQAVNQLTQALIDPDTQTLDKLTAEKLSYGHSSGMVENKDAFIEKLVSGRSDFVKIILENQSISISGDVALVRHDLKADIVDGGNPASIHLGILLVWQKQSGEWKLLARQAMKYLPTTK
ncbi:MAG: nuclear transport factor 2 family protein [Cellvibrio sp.]|nr:nuclear transport factor 2 family protein [Cellvibrio sp.]